MDVRVKDWSTEAHKGALKRTYPSLYASITRFILAFLGVWLFLYSMQQIFPFVQNGAAAVGHLKFEMAQSPHVFGSENPLRFFSFGNSKMLAGFQPATFNSTLGQGTSSFNLAIPGSNIQAGTSSQRSAPEPLSVGDERFVDLLEKALLAGNVPTHVLVQALPHTGADRSSLWSLIQDNKRMVNTLFPFRGYVRDAFLFAFEARSLSGVVPHYKSNAAQIMRLREDRGYYFIKSQSHFPGDRLPDDFSLPTDRPNEVLKRPRDVSDPKFLRLINLAEKYNFQILVIPVVYRKGEYAPSPATDTEMADPLRSFARIHVLRPAYWLYEPAAFSDPVHLNPTGAKRYTVELSDIVRRAVDEGL